MDRDHATAWSRREFMKGAAGAALAATGIVAKGASAHAQGAASASRKKVLVLGMDGLDPQLLNRFMGEGRLPHFEKLIRQGGFRNLLSSIPPQSPVAWSNFITGANPGLHGIFDFVHRDPKTYFPMLSLAGPGKEGKTKNLFGYQIPLSSLLPSFLQKGDESAMKLLRDGQAFWEILEDKGIPCSVIRMPANFPPVPMKGRSLSGMGTPDIRGSLGSFSYFASNPPAGYQDVTGGEVYPVFPLNDLVKCSLIGPRNAFKSDGSQMSKPPDAEIPFTVYFDPERPLAKLVIEDAHGRPLQEILLQEKAWSDWVRVSFPLIPHLASAHGAVRFYLKSLRPDFALYVTPVQMDPMQPDMPICTPDNYSREIAERLGLFFTQGLPENTKSLSEGILDDGEFMTHAMMIHDEFMGHFEFELDRFDEGFLFYYFGTSDQCVHMMWRAMDETHPAYKPELAPYKDAIAHVYEKMDEALALALGKIDPSTTLLIMSDHGFAPFYRGFHLNSWLLENGYIALQNEFARHKGEFLSNVDWTRTRAYGLGLNSLYINLIGRERDGTVSTLQKEILVDEICRKLLDVRDPETGEPPIVKAYKTSEVYQGSHLEDAPEIIVGYKRGYRASWDTSLGKFPEGLIEKNTEPWSADHCMAAEEIPGVLISNRPLTAESPALADVTVTVLKEFGIEGSSAMIGKPVL